MDCGSTEGQARGAQSPIARGYEGAAIRQPARAPVSPTVVPPQPTEPSVSRSALGVDPGQRLGLVAPKPVTLVRWLGSGRRLNLWANRKPLDRAPRRPTRRPTIPLGVRTRGTRVGHAWPRAPLSGVNVTEVGEYQPESWWSPTASRPFGEFCDWN